MTTQLDAVRRRILESVNTEWIDAAASAMSWPRETVVEALALMDGSVAETSVMMSDYCKYIEGDAALHKLDVSATDAQTFLRYLHARLGYKNRRQR